ncbi:cell division protein FtsQ/DivIB [Emcibacter sp. SYSU 3D8]|uniref:cell division protein FtsQ/DivIB n=1 Tax=Emcibacter sp. SYSU 3D8 TaxID=3133969 RepID=UPI0031FEF621
MSPLNPGRVMPGARDNAAAKRGGKQKRAGRRAMTDREAQAASFIHRRRMQRIRRIGAISGSVVVVVGGLWMWLAGTFTAMADAAPEMVPSISDLSGLTVNHIDVSGINSLEPEEIIIASGVEDGQKLGDIDLDVVRERVESVGWVRAARVSRILPGTIQIAVSERVPYAFWQQKRKLRLIDREGVEITQKDLVHFAKLPLVVGEGAPKHAKALFDIMDSEPALSARVKAAVRVGDRRWDLHFDNGSIVRLPEYGADAAWHRLAAVEGAKGILERDIVSVDMRLGDRTTVRLTPEAAQARRDAEAAAAKAAKALKNNGKG